MIKLLKNLTKAFVLFSLSGSVLAFGDQWYVGIGGGASQLLPDPDVANLSRDDEEGQTATVFIGQDFDRNSSGQIQLYSLGDAEFNNGESATYTAAEAALLYRFYDSRSVRSPSPLGVSIYGRFGFGVMDRDSAVEIEDAPPVYFGVGAGLETYITRNIGLRLEAQYLEEDAATATLSIVSRFGGRIRPTSPPPPVNTPTSPTFGSEGSPTVGSNGDPTESTTDQLSELGISQLPSVELIGENNAGPTGSRSTTTDRLVDRDNDGVDDSIDQCLRSDPGSQVNAAGCSVFVELAKQLRFAEGSAVVSENSRVALNQIARLMQQNNGIRLEIIAHTDNTGSEQQQSELARQRLRALGLYLVRQGIDQRRLLLRSFAGTQPAFSNTTAAGRAANNRIEIKEGF